MPSNIFTDYQDGAEANLLRLFSKGTELELEEDIRQILINEPSWAMLYHLSPQRRMLLDWYDFDPKGSVLEIGAGCGALTGLLTERAKTVYANELTEDRAEIIKRRLADRDNLTVVSENIQEMSSRKKFDYVTAIGVWEYSGRYITTDSDDPVAPFTEFLRIAHSLLSFNGHLLIAIENKMGLKYLSGAQEDHYSRLFESIQSYPNYAGIRTFDKTEVVSLLTKAGFNSIDFYYPFPDYKLPRIVLTDSAFEMNMSTSSYARTIEYALEVSPLFNEILLADMLRNQHLMSYFANSFFIDAIF